MDITERIHLDERDYFGFPLCEQDLLLEDFDQWEEISELVEAAKRGEFDKLHPRPALLLRPPRSSGRSGGGSPVASALARPLDGLARGWQLVVAHLPPDEDLDAPTPSSPGGASTVGDLTAVIVGSVSSTTWGSAVGNWAHGQLRGLENQVDSDARTDDHRR